MVTLYLFPAPSSPFPRFIWIEDGSQDPIPETDQPPNLVRTYDLRISEYRTNTDKTPI